MFNKLFKVISLTSIVFFVSFAFLFVPVEQVSAGEGYGLGSTGGEVEGLEKGEDPRAIIGDIIGAVLTFVGVLFLILVIYGGLLWMTARGNEQQIEKAKNLIGAAIIGLIIVLSAYAITAFIGTQLTG